MNIDIAPLWDFNEPALSEQRFRAALATAEGDDALIIQTQIARTYGLRGEFAQARQILAGIEPQIAEAGVEVEVRYTLELGRSYASTAHPPESQTDEMKERARTAFGRAFELARDGGLDYLAVDALHMMTAVDTAPEDQLAWNQKAVAYMNASSQPDTRKWAGSLHNNTGYALHLLGGYEEALAEFELALAARERDGTPELMRVAHWMIAWTLRVLGRLDEALAIQLQLEKEYDALGESDTYVFEELEMLYRALGNSERARFYGDRRKATQ